jgi:trehalose synthase-fused probable maltokinase
MITVTEKWERIFGPDQVAAAEARLLAWLPSTRWFGGKARTVASGHIIETIPVRTDGASFVLTFLELAYKDGGRETYAVPLTARFGEVARRLEDSSPEAIVSAVTVEQTDGAQEGRLIDALWDPACAAALVLAVRRGGRFPGNHGTLAASPTAVFADTSLEQDRDTPSVMKGEQSNTSVKFGTRAMLKLYRRVEAGVNPDLEIGRMLTAQRFSHSPPVLGALEYGGPGGEPATIAIVHGFTENQGNAWQYTLSELDRYLKRRSAGSSRLNESPETAGTADDTFIEAAAKLGRRTAELHVALSQAGDNAAFAPEDCTPDYWRAVSDRIVRSIQGAMGLLRSRMTDLAANDRQRAEQVLSTESALSARAAALAERNPTAVRIRCHGDYHLGQVLYTGRDFVIIDFEGEPARPLAERRAKHVSMVDVAGMIRSFHYAAYVALRQQAGQGLSEEPSATQEESVSQWYHAARTAFLEGYDGLAATALFWPPVPEERDLLLDVHLIDKALYELSYELNNRPAWVGVPLRGILQLVEPEESPIFK